MTVAQVPSSVLGKVVTVLSAFGPEDPALTLADLVQRTGLSKTTVHRLLVALLEARLVERDAPHGRFRLGGRLFELGMLASVERRLLEVAMPFLHDLYMRTHETVHLGVLEGTEVLYVSQIGGHRQMPAASRLGGQMPLHCTAIGKVLLAHSDDDLFRDTVAHGLERRTPHTLTAPGLLRRQLKRCLETGVAYDHEESAIGLVCVAAPVLDREDRPLAAISMTAGSVTRFCPEQHVAPLRAAAAGVAATLARRAEMLEP